MGTRTVSVDLQLKAAGFVAGAKEAEKATNSLNDELTDVAKHGKDFDAAVADADKLTVAVKETGHQVDNTGTQMKEAGADARFLAAELAKARTAALEAAAAFTLTGERADLIQYKKSNRYASDLEKLAKDLAGGDSATAQAAKSAGVEVGKALQSGAKSGFDMKAVVSDPVVLAALAPAVIELGAGVGGLLLTGIGLAGIGAGIAGQIHNPLVEQAALGLAATVSTGFKTATNSFAVPIATVLNDARDEWTKLSSGLTTTFEYLSSEVPTIGKGVIGFIDKLVPGLERAAVEAEPLVDTFSNWLPQAGEEFAGLLNTMSDHASELNDGLKLVLGTVSATVDLLNYGVSAGSWLFNLAEATTGTVDAVISLGDAGGDTTTRLDVMTNSQKAAAAAADAAVPSYADLEKQLRQTELTADMLAGEMVDQVFTALMATDQATLQLAESQTRLGDSLKQNGKNFDIHTAKGQANTEAVYAAIQANIKMYDTMIASGVGAKDAATAYDANTAALEKQLHKAGVAQTTIDQLIGKYRQVPDKVDTDISMNGLADAINGLNDLIRQLNHLPARVKTTIESHYISTGSGHKAERWGGIEYAADGLVSLGQAGMYSNGPVYGFAEPQTGGEAFVPRNGDFGRSAGILSEAAGWYGLSVGRPFAGAGGGGGGGGSSAVDVRLSWAGGGDGVFSRAIMQGLRVEIQGKGGNVQKVLGQGVGV